MTLLDMEIESTANPLDMIEQIAALNEWQHERSNEDEIIVTLSGVWADYHLSFTWITELETVHLASALDLRVPDNRKAEVIKLLALVNEHLWLGHFDLWSDEGLIMFRSALLLAGTTEATPEQIEALLTNTVECCDNHYQAFQFVIWAGKSASEALTASLFQTVGEA